MAKTVKIKSGEAITPDRIRKVIETLEAGGTKKTACDILGIRYNTTRLQKIIDDFVEREANEQRLKDRKKGTAVEREEAVDIIKEYLESASIEKTAKMFFRSPYIVSTVLEFYGAKLHQQKKDYFKPALMPDICMVDSLSIGEYVWASRYNMLAIVKKAYPDDVYAIRVLGKYEKDAFQKIEDLGSLRHLEALGLNFKTIRIHEHARAEADD